MLLNEYKLVMPSIAINEWLKAAESASGLLREVLSAQTEGARLLQAVKETTASTERIGWLNLWAKAFAALEAVAAAVTHNSKLVLLLCQRNSFELMLQAHTVMDPLRDLGNKPAASRSENSEEYALRSAIDRLRAYTAWCLWHDQAYFKEVLNPKSLRDVWDPESVDHLRRAVDAAPVFEQFVKKAGHRIDEATMLEGSRNMRKLYSEKIKQIDEWMADPRLRKWADAMDRASKNNIVGIPFFILFDRSEASIPKRLLKEGIRFTYSAYIMSSMASHGSSMEEFIQIQNNTIKPTLTGDEEQINILAPEVIFRCRHNFTLLGIINQEMLKNPQIRS